MNRERASRAYDLIAEGFAELAIAVRELEPDAARASVPRDVPIAPAVAAAAGSPPAAAADLEQGSGGYQPRGNVDLRNEHVANVLGQCPTHQRNWVVKEGGVSQAGKPYSAFWKCPEKDPTTRSGYCDKRPVKAWVDQNPIGTAAA